jgi:hypothetical protein
MADSLVDDELRDGFHRCVDMTSREPGERLRTSAAGAAHWRHRPTSVGHHPLKPVAS